jgi:hypothetical protein
MDDDNLKKVFGPRNKTPKILFKEPNTTQNFYGKDNGSSFKLKEKGRDTFSSHVVQETNWNNISFNYTWNSLGLRGPEPNYSAKNKILFLGGSLCIGTGVPVENSFPDILAKMLDANYINMSDCDSIADFIEPVKKFVDYDPQYVIISEPRFVQSYGWALIDLYGKRDLEHTATYKKLFKRADDEFLLMFEAYLKNLFPNAKLILTYSMRKSFLTIPKFNYFSIIKFTKNDLVDLGRDNMHPGIRTHQIFAEKIYNQAIDNLHSLEG